MKYIISRGVLLKRQGKTVEGQKLPNVIAKEERQYLFELKTRKQELPIDGFNDKLYSVGYRKGNEVIVNICYDIDRGLAILSWANKTKYERAKSLSNNWEDKDISQYTKL